MDKEENKGEQVSAPGLSDTERKQYTKLTKLVKVANKYLFVVTFCFFICFGYTVGILINMALSKGFAAAIIGLPQACGIMIGAMLGGFFGLMLHMTTTSILKNPEVDFNFFRQMMLEKNRILKRPKEFLHVSDEEDPFAEKKKETGETPSSETK